MRVWASENMAARPADSRPHTFPWRSSILYPLLSDNKNILIFVVPTKIQNITIRSATRKTKKPSLNFPSPRYLLHFSCNISYFLSRSRFYQLWVIYKPTPLLLVIYKPSPYYRPLRGMTGARVHAVDCLIIGPMRYRPKNGNGTKYKIS